MEFDTNISLKPREKASFRTEEDLEAFDGELWKLLSRAAKEVGQGSGGELWADYSTKLQTRHLVVRVEEGEKQDGGHVHGVEVLSGTKPSRTADVVVMAMAVAAVWGVSRYSQPGASPVWCVVFVVAAAVAGLVLALSSGKAFGAAQARWLLGQMENKYEKI